MIAIKALRPDVGAVIGVSKGGANPHKVAVGLHTAVQNKAHPQSGGYFTDRSGGLILELSGRVRTGHKHILKAGQPDGDFFGQPVNEWVHAFIAA